MVQRALLVGIDQYPDPRNNLNSCIADTLAFRDILVTAYGVSQGDITLLHNQAATLDNVRTALDSLLNGLRDGEKVVYFESSHGYRYPKGDTMVEVLCLYDAFLEDTELVSRSQAAPGDCLTVITDACHSGGLNKLFFPLPAPAWPVPRYGSRPRIALPLTSPPRGRCPPSSSSGEPPPARWGR